MIALSSSIRTQIGILVIATSLVQLASGFFGTFVSLRVAIEGFEVPGLVLSAYFAGFTLGAFRCSRIIERIGHIRAYAAFAGLVAAALAMMPLLIGSLSWVILRAIIGFGCAGIFVTTESWLTAKAPPSERGRVFSIYMVGTFLALALGQLLIARADIKAAASFNAMVALFAVALIMVTAARAEPPRVSRRGRTALWFARASRAYRCDGLRLERARGWYLLRARSGVDAGSGHPTGDHRAVYARGCAWRICFPNTGRSPLRPARPTHRAGIPQFRLCRHRVYYGAPASLPSDDPASRSLARRFYVNTLPGLRRARPRSHAGRSGRGSKRTAHPGERPWFGAGPADWCESYDTL